MTRRASAALGLALPWTSRDRAFGEARLLRIAASSRRKDFTDEPDVTSFIAGQGNLELVSHGEFQQAKFVEKQRLKRPFVLCAKRADLQHPSEKQL
jgi:hypothetical protein